MSNHTGADSPWRVAASWALVAIACVLLAPGTAIAQTWTQHGEVAAGYQFDAMPGPNGRIHMVTAHYLQFDATGAKVVDEDVGDGAQNVWMNAPSIAVAQDGTVHIATREGSDLTAGFELRYRRREPSGAWTADYYYDSRWKWNWHAVVADDGNGNTHLLSTRAGDDVWAALRLFQAGPASATHIGDLNGVYRVDNDVRMRGVNGTIYFASGDNMAPMTLSWGHGGPGLVGELEANKRLIDPGQHAGFPDLYIDGQGALHYTYGSGTTNHATFPANCVAGKVHYNKLDAAANPVFSPDRTVLTALSAWHLSIGLSAVAASDSGKTVVAVGLRTNDDKEGDNSDMLWSYSTDGGATWAAQQALGATTTACEGRHRPRLAALGSKFFLFFTNTSGSGIRLATIEFPPDAPVAPSALAASAVSSTAIALTWTDNSDNETGFSIERRLEAADSSSWAEATTLPADATIYEDGSLEPTTAYRYRVRAFTAEAGSTYTNEATATTLPSSGRDTGADPQKDAGLDSLQRSDASRAGDDAPPPSMPNLVGGCGCGTGDRSAAPFASLALIAMVLVAARVYRRARRSPPKSLTSP